ncbi:MAG: hypothetical protein R3E88_14900 [Myxococcota bacterium]
MTTRERSQDDALGAEAADQLHHRDDKRDAAEMRIEELVRDVEYDEESHDEGSRATPAVLAAGALVTLLVLGALAWLYAMWL